MLVDPNLNSPANIDAAVHLKNDPEGWKKKASRIPRMGIFGRDEKRLAIHHYSP